MNHAIVVGAGKSARMKSKESKIFLPLLDRPLIYHTIKIFEKCNLINNVVVVAQKNDIEKIKKIIQQYSFKKITNIVEGGQERQDSVYNGLMSIKNAKKDDVVVVHNASNPLVKEHEIISCINDAKQYGAAACAFPLKDTIKKIKNNFVEKTIDRKDVWQMQTPQAIQYGIFVEAFDNFTKNKKIITDDVSLVELIGKEVKIIPCSYENIKITTPEDLTIAEGILMMRNKALKFDNNTENDTIGLNNKKDKIKNIFDFRIGIGQDSHSFSKPPKIKDFLGTKNPKDFLVNKYKKLILGGFIVPNETGLEANSDGDIILHALFNAISTAIGEKSLGFYADDLFKKGIVDSKKYLDIILKKIYDKKLKINNISISVEAMKPKLEKYNDEIKNSLSKILKISKDRIGISFTSGEGLTPFGKGEGMRCFVVVSLVNI